MTELEQIKKSLEELTTEVSKLKRDKERLEAANACRNMVGRYLYYHSSYKHKEFMDMWAKHTPGTMLEMPWGVYFGYEGVCRCYLEQHCDYNDIETRRGRLNMHLVTTEVLEVAEDGQTARGVWLSPGIETDKGHPAMTEEEIDPQLLKMLRAKLGADYDPSVAEPPSGEWAWSKYGFDFVKEDGEWKIWKMVIYPLFKAPYDTCWVDMPPTDFSGMMENADAPPTNPTYNYTVDALYPDDQPDPPVPYESYDNIISAPFIKL